MKRFFVLALVLAIALPGIAMAQQAEPHSNNALGFKLGVMCAPFFAPPVANPIFGAVQGNLRALNFNPGDPQDDYAAAFCDSDSSGTFTAGDAILCCKRMNGKDAVYDATNNGSSGSSAKCASFGVADVVPVDADGDGVIDYFAVLINPNGPPNACFGIKQSDWNSGAIGIND